MTQSSLPSYTGSSRSRFLTFGGALILAACLTLVKLTLVALDLADEGTFTWKDLSDLQPSVALSSTPTDARSIPWPVTLPEPAAGPTDPNDAPATPFADEAPSSAEAIAAPLESAFDPSRLTEGEIAALQQLATRSRQLDERERLLDIRAELNGRTEERLDQQINRLTGLKERIEALVGELDEAEEQKLARLVKIYETMKPKAAAEIFNRLEIPVLLHVIERMKEAKSAVVLGRMDPAIAKRVTTELAKRKERPDLDGDG